MNSLGTHNGNESSIGMAKKSQRTFIYGNDLPLQLGIRTHHSFSQRYMDASNKNSCRMKLRNKCHHRPATPRS